MARSPERLSDASCLLCGAGRARHLVTKRGFEVVRCTECGLVYVWPPPTREELEAFYASGGYHAEVDEAERRRTFAERLRRRLLEGHLPRGRPRRGLGRRGGRVEPPYGRGGPGKRA